MGTRKLETYAFFKNIDRSILSLNIMLKKYGCEFICFDIQDFEKKFSSLFYMFTNFENRSRVSLHSGISISNEFFQALLNNNIFGGSILEKEEIIFLKVIDDLDLEVSDDAVHLGKITAHFGKFQQFVALLIQQLWLFKNGGVICPIQFQIEKENRSVISKFETSIYNVNISSLFSLTDNEVEKFGEGFKATFTTNSLTELAISNFNLSYEISNIKTKFITLMTCLESLFNQGTDQISHIVSRHLSLIISSSEEEFKENYAQIKKLYSLRSRIVHGENPNTDLNTATNELQIKVRQAINYCLNLNLSKAQFFDKLNGSGVIKF